MEEDDIDAELARLTEKMRPRGEILRRCRGRPRMSVF